MRHSVPADLRSAAQLDSLEFYAQDPYPVFAQLRREAPVYWYEPGNFWAASTYAGVSEVSTNHQLYSAARQGTRLADRSGSRKAVAGGVKVFTTDPPEHTAYRRVISRVFTPRGMAGMDETVRSIAHDLISGIEYNEFDFTTALAEPLPIFVIGGILGLPREDWPKLKRWTDARVEIFDTPADTPKFAELEAELLDYYAYLEGAVREREGADREDLLSLIANTEWMSFPDRVQMLNSVIVAGNETTRCALSAGMAELANSPAQWNLLGHADDELLRSTCEETLRWATPVNYFARTAVQDTELLGEHISADDFVLMFYLSANRDESIWNSADTFDITRPIKPHLAFGTGIHVCLGAALARLEIQIVLSELRRAFTAIELTGPVDHRSSVQVQTFHHIPLVVKRK